jgi:predicted nucleic acid-binding protein
LGTVPCRGRSIHDALLVATMQVHRVPRLITSNTSDFARFADRITLLEPSDALPG